MVSDETWSVITDPFEGHPVAAHNLAYVFHDLIEELRASKKAAVIAVLEEGIEKLYPLTKEFREASKLYRLSLNGDLRPEDEPLRVFSRASEQ